MTESSSRAKLPGAKAAGLALLLVFLLLVAGGLSLAVWRGGTSAVLPEPRPTGAAGDTVEGEVRSADGPLAGATVRFKGRNGQVRTDAAGRFRLPRTTKDDIKSDTNADLVTAWKEGFLIGGSRLSADADPIIRLTPLPSRDHAAYAWVAPTPDRQSEHNCGNCHAEIYRQWRGGGHANSARNERFFDLYHNAPATTDADWSLLRDMPDGAAVCASCHAPTVDFGHPGSSDLSQVDGVAAEGVHCDFCHKVRDVSVEHVGLSHGRFGMELLRPSEGQLFFGPLDDVDRGEDVYSPVQSESRYCASCHEGVLFGVHVYSTYSEWLASPARRKGKQCQTCHMASDGRMTNFAPDAGGIERDPASLASHELLPGGHQGMLRKCLQVSVVARHETAAVSCDVEVLARDVGHRVPTGYIDRHLILLVEAFDSADRPLAALSGPKLPAAAGPRLKDQPGQLFARLLTSAQGKAPIPFWQAVEPPHDTRLRPEQPEQVKFRFPRPTVRLRVRLLYRRFWDEVATAKQWPSDEIVVHDQNVEVAETD